jgi:hypothetical protein
MSCEIVLLHDIWHFYISVLNQRSKRRRKENFGNITSVLLKNPLQGGSITSTLLGNVINHVTILPFVVIFNRCLLPCPSNFFFKGSLARDFSSVAEPDPNPDPDPSDSHVFGPPGFGSRSICQRYGYGSGSGSGSRSGSGSFYHQAKKVRKTLIPTAFWLLFDFLSLKMMYMYLYKVISKKLFF